MRWAILCNDQGLTRIFFADDSSESMVTIQWQDLTTVRAFKRDLFAYDLMCIVFGTAVAQLEVDEQMDGWQDMIEALLGHVPGLPNATEWWDKVALPAFATNATILFTVRRPGSVREARIL